MPDPATFGLFLSAAFILSITPGPGVLYTLARTLHGGRDAGILSSLGLFVGGLVHVVAAAIGISSLLMTSAIAFTLVKYAGAAYLIYLGVRTLLSSDSVAVTAAEARQKGQVFYQGVVTEALNPKTALFFLAFIPQFIQVEGAHVFLQFLGLGLITAVMNMMSDLTVVMFAEPIGRRLRGSDRFRRRQRMVSGFGLIGLGTYVAVAERS